MNDPQTDRLRALHFLEVADFVRDAYFRDGLSVQEIGAALRHAADEADPMVGGLARDGVGLDEIAAKLREPAAVPVSAAAPQADQTALRERIKLAIHSELTEYRLGRDTGMIVQRLTDAALAVLLPPADRAAILREAEGALRAQWKRIAGEFNDGDILHEDGPASAVATWQRAADLLGRMADEAQQPEAELGATLARHITEQPMSTVLAALRILGWPITFELQPAGGAQQPETQDTDCGPAPDECDAEAGEPCANHEREQAHAEGEHCFCGPECAVPVAEPTDEEA